LKLTDSIAPMGVQWNNLGGVTASVWARCYVWIPSAPTGQPLRLIAMTDTGGVTRGAFEVNTTGKARWHSGGAATDGAVTFPTAQMVRCELRTIANAGAGEVEIRWWSSPDSFGTATDTVLGTGQNNGAEITNTLFGSGNNTPTAPYTTWIDDVAISVGTWIGPSASTIVNTVVPTVTGSLNVGSTLTANPGTWVPTPSSFNYFWHRMDDAAGTNLVEIGATGSTYTLSSSDLNKFIRAGVTPVA